MENSITQHMVMGFLVAALFISSSIICATNRNPKILGIPALGMAGYLLAFVLAMLIFIDFLKKRKRRR